MYAEERQHSIGRTVLRRGRMSVADLAREYAVTTETVRRDLDVLERTGVLRRVHGGAVPVGAIDEALLSERDTTQVDAKERIAKRALELLPETDLSLLLDAGTTTGRIVTLLPRDRRITVFTHAVPLAAQLAGRDNVELQLLPGRVRPTTHAAVGADTVAAISRLRVDLVLLGANGVTADHGLSTPDSEEAAVKRAMVGAARRRVVLADSSKLGRADAISFAALDEVDAIVTDANARETKDLADAGLEVLPA
jgi:DeoR family fructose operon transcriptional repressor